jgi:hypothetical protein
LRSIGPNPRLFVGAPGFKDGLPPDRALASASNGNT